ncbi:MAG: rod shape-determining protein RodA [Gammaproteobacteria bacterium]|nr:rod shape-determining protein RodA [Gammaproteobacteria bacterium]
MDRLGTIGGKPPRESDGINRFIIRTLHIDLPLLVGLVMLATIGLVTLYSASNHEMSIVNRQIFFMLIGFAGMFIFAQIPPHTLRFWAPWLFSIGIIMLIAVFFFGSVGKGAQRWLDLGFVRFQPSESMKIGLPMMLAWFLAEAQLPPSAKQLLISAVLIALPAGLIVIQPDLGTSLLIGSTGVIVLLLAGISWLLIGSFILLAAISAPLLWYLLHDYQRQRILTFLNPENDPLGSGYHIIQSKIAIGSGGLYGKGWLNGSQSHLEFLPERTTDFIFAVFSEEFGFIGIILLMSLYMFIVVRGLYIAAQAQDTFSRLLSGSLILTFFVYIFVNTGMVMGLLPVVGLPLPLLSLGGTSLVTLMAGFGIIMSVHTHRKLYST